MPNPENVKPYEFTSEQSSEEAAKNGRKGGIASGEARRKKKTLRETAEIMLACELPPDVKRKLKSNGLEADDYKDAVIAAAIQSIIRGNSNMFGQFVKLMGEGVENISLNIPDDESVKELDEWVENARTDFKHNSE